MSAQHKLLLFGAVLSAAAGLSRFAVADELPTLAQAGAPEGWYTEGEAAVGGQVFIKKPGDTPSNSAAKFNEYGDRTDPFSLSSINFGVVKRDGTFRADLHGSDIGADNQKLEADLEQPGAQYLALGWYKTPQLRSNTAQTIFGGVGSTNLTVPDNVVQALYGALFPFGGFSRGAGTFHDGTLTGAASKSNTTTSNSSQTVVNGLAVNGAPGTYNYNYLPWGCFTTNQTGSTACNGKTPVQTTISANENRINLGIERDRKEIDYRWTANEHWNIDVNYSNEHRFGTQEQGFLFSSSTTTPLAQVPMPVDDWTQEAAISAEYFDKTPWGGNWNAMLKYGVSLYTDAFNSFTAENPFGGPVYDPTSLKETSVTPNCPIASSATTPNCYSSGQMGTAPDNAAQTVTGQIGVDLPGFKSNRYMGTLQFTQMTQNQAFIPMTINPVLAKSLGIPLSGSGLSRSSLQGDINTTLFNNVLSTQLTSDLKNKLSYRIYDYQNDTPALKMLQWAVNDSAISTPTSGVGAGTYSPHTELLSAYTKQNASDELTWNATKWATIGASTGWEQYRYSEYAVNETNEYTEKVFGHLTPTDWLTVRFDDGISWRRYEDYNWLAFVGDLGVGAINLTTNPVSGNLENPALVDFDLANRNRNFGDLYIDVTTPISGLTITPTAGYRWDDYPTDNNLLANSGSAIYGSTQAAPTQLGLRTDHHWNVGLEADWTINSNVSFVASYTFEQIRQSMIGTSSTNNTASTGYYQSDMGENVNTWTVGANFQLIPDRLALKLSGTYELARDNWNTGPYSCPAAAPTANCGIVSPGNPAYPPENTTFSHLDATLTYKFDPTVVMQLGKGGEAYLQLHYLWERENVTNWQANGTSTYMYSTLNSSTTAFKDMIFLAGDNPNYNAQAISASLVVKW
ncbi:MAG: MtrB/PioB family outer membrane beta-barrel protein [Roseiarcus sp.]|jgi:hypothetical protein